MENMCSNEGICKEGAASIFCGNVGTIIMFVWLQHRISLNGVPWTGGSPWEDSGIEQLLYLSGLIISNSDNYQSLTSTVVNI